MQKFSPRPPQELLLVLSVLVHIVYCGAPKRISAITLEPNTSGWGIGLDSNDGTIYVSGFTSNGFGSVGGIGQQDCFLLKLFPNGTRAATPVVYGTTAIDECVGIFTINAGILYAYSNALEVPNYIYSFFASNLTLASPQPLSMGSTVSNTRAYSPILTDGQSLFVAGYFSSPAGQGLYGETGLGTTASNWDGFVSRFWFNLTRVWTRYYGSGSYDFSGGFAVNPSTGFLFLSGITWGNFDGQTRAGGADAFIRQMFISNGTQTWTQFVGGTADETFSTGLAISESFLYFTCSTASTSVNGVSAVSNLNDYILVKYWTNGSLLWTRMFGSTGNDHHHEPAISIHPITGFVYITAFMDGSIPSNPTEYGSKDVTLTVYDPMVIINGQNSLEHQIQSIERVLLHALHRMEPCFSREL